MVKFSYLMVKSYNLMGNSRPCFHDKNPVPKVPSEVTVRSNGCQMDNFTVPYLIYHLEDRG